MTIVVIFPQMTECENKKEARLSYAGLLICGVCALRMFLK